MSAAQGIETAAPDRVQPLDPDSPAGRAATVALCDLIADVDERLRREGQPVPIDIPA